MIKPVQNNFLSLACVPNETEFAVFWNDYAWTAQQLGKKVNPGSTETKLYFHKIKQIWLLKWIKKFIFYRASFNSFSTLTSNLKSIKKFSTFLFKFHSDLISLNQIDENILANYYLYLRQSNCKAAYIKSCLIGIKVFIDTGNSNNWFRIPCEFITDWIGISHKEIKQIPRFIPDSVLKELNQYIEFLPEPVQRMVLVIQECGFRISELVSLKLDCLQQDSKGGWFINFTHTKIKKEDIIPISNELAGVIKAQQDYIQNVFQNKYQYLFCSTKRYFKKGELHDFVPQAKIMPSAQFNKYLNWLFRKFNIHNSSGETYSIQSHQFRHTVGTKMINNNVPHHIIQRYLGHSSPAMTSVYAHLLDSTLRKEFDNYHSKVVNIAGETIESEFPELDNNQNLQWMKKQILGEILPNGYCALPANLTCSKGNACLQCGDFRTTLESLDKHKEHRERTHQALDIAKTNNWQRQIQVNGEILSSLNNIIDELEQG